jgi:hypothetical protein
MQIALLPVATFFLDLISDNPPPPPTGLFCHNGHGQFGLLFLRLNEWCKSKTTARMLRGTYARGLSIDNLAATPQDWRGKISFLFEFIKCTKSSI